MGCKAEGAAQGYTVLGSIILFLFALQMIIGGLNGAIGGDFASVIDVVLGIALFLMAILALDACGFIYWKVQRSGLLLAIFGLVSIFIVGRGLSFNILSWLMNIGMLAGLMFLIAGLLIILKS
ncbi:MAG: hypothetical protein ACTSYL_00885 [Candidatus Thorarchaeota archaeon]